LRMKSDETSEHLFLHCPFAHQIWGDINIWLGIQNLCRSIPIDLCLESWFQRIQLRVYRSIPFIVVWGMWMVTML